VEETREASLDLLVDLARPAAGDVVLDYATGAGMAGFTIAPDVATVEAADELPDLLEEGKRLAAELGLVNVAFTLVDLYALPYRDGMFDLVVCRNSFHLLPEPVAALTELQRVLAPQGRVVLLDVVVDDATDKPLNELARLREPAHRRHYRRAELEDIVARAGFAVRESGDLRRTIDLDYWLQAAAVPPPKAELIRGRIKALPVDVQIGMDVAFTDKAISFSYDIIGLRLERA
jgi:ubiquinone/menaquinone biosynthesis C-methylase UbiE